MKKLFLLISISILTLFSNAQIITTSPQFLTQSGGAFDIIYDASLGATGLKNLAATDTVFAHAGVITSLSKGSTDWKHAPVWGDNSKKYKLTSLGNNKWKLSITPDMTSYYGLSSGEIVTKLAFVFRNKTGSLTGKDIGGADLFVNVYQSGLNVAFVSPSSDGVTTVGTIMPIKIASSINSSLKININGTDIKASAADSTTLTTTFTFTNTTDYTLIGSATVSGTTVYDTVYICVPAPVTTQTRPTGLTDGINYIDSNTATLVLYAPNKSNVFLIGEFNNWLQLNAYQMKKDGDYWWYTLTNLTPGKMYGFQYLVDSSIRSSDPYTELVLDPWNDQWINQYNTIFPNMKPYPVGKTTGLVATLQTSKTAYNWQIPNFTVSSTENLVIYETLLRDFTKEKSLDAAILKLDYLKNLGITAVELMPIQEFDGNNSWGYNPNHYFAPDKAYGTPDTYKKFIDECHKRGIAVILDMVFNQASGICPFALLYWDSVNNRPAANNPWMNAVAPHNYSVLNDFNHNFTGTKEYFKRVLKYWINEYKVDGYRMDLAKGFTQNSGTEESYDIQRIGHLTDYYNAAKEAKSDVMFILEHLGASSEQTELANRGMYLWQNMNNSFCQAAMGFQSSSDFSGMISTPRKWVGYAESHDEERNFFKAKTYGTGTLKTDSVARIKRVPLNIAFTTLLPGPKMIYEFGEMGFDYSINSNGGRTNEKQPSWNWLNLTERKAAADACAKIITLRKLYPTAFTQGSFVTSVTSSDWSQGRRIALSHSSLNMIVLGNFDASIIVNANPLFPNTGTWYNLITGQPLIVTNTNMSIQMSPGDLLIYTDRIVDFPNSVNAIVADMNCNVFPTSTVSKVYITSTGSVKNVQVYNLQGAQLKSELNTNEVDLSALSKGMYLVDVITTAGRSVHKIVKE
ncbi:MAG: alpha-amylase family glycosyl hydrolase [Paludibacter sp.]